MFFFIQGPTLRLIDLIRFIEGFFFFFFFFFCPAQGIFLCHLIGYFLSSILSVSSFNLFLWLNIIKTKLLDWHSISLTFSPIISTSFYICATSWKYIAQWNLPTFCLFSSCAFSVILLICLHLWRGLFLLLFFKMLAITFFISRA